MSVMTENEPVLSNYFPSKACTINLTQRTEEREASDRARDTWGQERLAGCRVEDSTKALG